MIDVLLICMVYTRSLFSSHFEILVMLLKFNYNVFRSCCINVMFCPFVMSLRHAVHVLFDQSSVIWCFRYCPTRGCWNGFCGITETGILRVSVAFIVSPAISAIVHVMFMLYCPVQAPVVQRLDNTIHRINRYPADKC